MRSGRASLWNVTAQLDFPKQGSDTHWLLSRGPGARAHNCCVCPFRRLRAPPSSRFSPSPLQQPYGLPPAVAPPMAAPVMGDTDDYDWVSYPRAQCLGLTKSVRPRSSRASSWSSLSLSLSCPKNCPKIFISLSSLVCVCACVCARARAIEREREREKWGNSS